MIHVFRKYAISVDDDDDDDYNDDDDGDSDDSDYNDCGGYSGSSRKMSYSGTA